MNGYTERYLLGLNVEGAVEMEVTREQWVRAERSAGFWPKGVDRGQPATGGFSNGQVRGRIEHVKTDET